MGIGLKTFQQKFSNLTIDKKKLLFLLVLLYCHVFSQNGVSLKEVKKEADKLFEEEEFTKAYKPYAQLVANFPKDPEYNYRLGVCMIYSEPDKKKCIPYLKVASNNPKEAPKDVNFYLGKAYHINYLFDEAIKHYIEFKKTASSSQQKKLQVDREIKSCENGKHLLSNLSDLVVQSKKQLNEIDYFRSYDLKSIGGKLLVKPEDFKTAVDKKKKEKSVIFLPKGSNVVYFSSYGENLETGKDIYTAAKLPNNTYSKPEKVKGINTEFDDDYPFLHPDGKTLYFASKGYNSMGGYDVFKTVFNEETNSWSAPVNLEFPINSPDDDFLFVTDSLEKTAYFSTGRQSPPGKIDVLKINTERKPIDILAIKGKVIKATDEQSLNSIVTIKNIETETELGTYNANDVGDYLLNLPNGAKLLFTVETPGLKTQTETIEFPVVTSSKPIRQTINYEDGILKINNYFDGEASDDDYLQYLKVIEKKAKLEVNEGENKLTAPLATTEVKEKDTVVVKKKNTSAPELIEVIEENPVTSNTVQSNPTNQTQSLNNNQLANMAKQDAEEAAQEAKQLQQDADEASELGTKQKADAENQLSEINDALKKAEDITDEEEKKTTIEKLTTEKKSTENKIAIATKILGYASALKDDAKTKVKEADLNNQYAKELENSNKPKNNNEQTAKRIEELQKEIELTANQTKSSEKAYNSIKEDVDQKEKQIADIEKINNDVKTNLDEIKLAIENNESELAKTKKKSAKENINTQISAFKAEQTEKEKQIVSNNDKIKNLNEELDDLKNELEITTKIKTENIVLSNSTDPPKVPTAVKEENPESIAGEPVEPILKETNKNLVEKYKQKIEVADSNNKESLEKSNAELKNFNKEIDNVIEDDKRELLLAKSEETKNEITSEIDQLEISKKQNLQQLASNAKKIEELTKNTAKNNNQNLSEKNIIEPINAQDAEEAVAQLTNLNKQLSVNESENFEFNSYQNPKAQNLKVEADSKINDAIAKQKKLKDIIDISKNELNNSSFKNEQVSIEQLNKEAEEQHSMAIKLLNEAKTKEGSEKEKLVQESKALEEKVNEKYLQIAEVTKKDNTSSFETNQANFSDLIAENKSSDSDKEEAKRINEDASLAFKQALQIRSEAQTLTNAGAKLGSLSNAEEKEAEAIIKQQQAIDILKKSNPEFNLKIAVLSTNKSSGNQNSNETVNSKLENVNKEINELIEVKISSYQTLVDANNLEIEQINANIENNKSKIDNTPSLKSDFISGNNKLETAKTLLQQSNEAANPGEKLNKLILAIKKQNEAVKQLSALNNSFEVASKEPEINSTNPSEKNKTEEVNTEIIENPVAVKNDIEVKENLTGETTTNEIENKESEVSDLIAKNDTSTAQILNYIENVSIDIKNPQALELSKNALSELKSLETEGKTIESEIKNTNQKSNSKSLNYNSAQLKAKADSTLMESEELTEDAIATRNDAKNKTGETKAELIAKAKEYEKQSQETKFKAASLYQAANENDYQNNRLIIDDLIEKLKVENPKLYSELEEKNNEIKTLKTQSNELRQEAEALANADAKLGGISNAEEKELEMISKQNQLVKQLKKQYPDYAPPVNETENKTTENEVPVELIAKKNQNLQKQFTELTNLTNAFSLEYETSKNSLNSNLTQDQQIQKKKADDLNSESKRLLIKSANEKNPGQKLKSLTLAVKAGNKAIEELNKLSQIKNNVTTTSTKKDLDALSEIGSAITNNNETRTQNTKPNKVSEKTTTKTATKIDGLEIVRGNAYSADKPIPIDAKMEDGLVFRVQIGAFKTVLPNDVFKGLSPLNAETTPNGYYRYTAGNFNKFETANAVKNDLRGLGYQDAFVVGFYNGKRISVSEALAILAKEGKTIDSNAPQTAGITANSNLPKANAIPSVNNVNSSDNIVTAKELEKINGLLFTVQIGVYSKKVTKQGLQNLKPIYTEQLQNGLYRYTAGIYNNADRVILDKNKVNEIGFKDAFISAYLNGKRISFNDGKERQKNDPTIKMENENPIEFSESTAEVNRTENNGNTNLNTQPPNSVSNSTQPFSNGISNYPAATEENGVKQNEEGISFKVQIGAYSKQVPNDVADKFSAIKNWPIENKQINNLFIYNVGNFTEAKFAKTLKDEAIRIGISDAFITVYKDGKKVYGQEATLLMTR